MGKGSPQRPKKTLSSDSVLSQSDINQQIRAAKARAKKLLANAGKDIRTVRREVSALKKAGIVSKRIDARTYQPSKYMLKKIAANKDILSGEAIAVKASKEIREKYVSAGVFETRGGAVIVPKDRANQRARIKRGLIETKTKLKNGEEQKIILPFKANSLQDIAEKLRDDPSLDGLKDPNELWGARLFGHNIASGFGFPDGDELANYILEHYQRFFSGKNKQAALRNFELVRFYADDSTMPESDPSRRIVDDEYRRRNKQGNQWANDRRKKRKALQKKLRRERETPEQREKRLSEQRERSRRNREQKKGN